MKILGTKLDIFNYQELLETVKYAIENRKKITLSYVNIYIAVYADKNEKFNRLLEKFDCLYNDGKGIYWASKFLYGKTGLKEYLTGTDLYYKILELSDRSRKKIFFYGGDSKAKELIKKKLEITYPELKLSGHYCREQKFNDEILHQMNSSGADILFVGLGTPLQEEFVCNNYDKINIPVIVTVGSGIDYISGYLKRAPLLMRKMGLEWLFRMFIEPRRLFKRYIFGIPVFIFKVIIQKFKLILKYQKL